MLRRVDPHAPRSAVYRVIARLSGTRAAGLISRVIAWRLDPLLMRATGGRVRMSGIIPSALLETEGARTGAPRSTAVIYFHDGEDVIVVASKLGLPAHPAWYHNARAHPDVVLGGEPFRAEAVSDEAERTRLWALADAVFAPFAAYRKRAAASGRTIPLVRLVPR